MTIYFYCPLCIRAFIDCVSHWSYKSPSVCTLRVAHWCLMGCKLSTACLSRICCCTQYCTDLYTHCTPHCTSHFQCTLHCTMTVHCTQTGPINLPPASRLKLIFFLQRMTSLSTMRPMDRTIPILDLRNVFLSLDDSFFIHHLKFSIWTIIYTWSKNNVVENGILFEVKSYKTFNNQIVCGPFSHPSRHYTI